MSKNGKRALFWGILFIALFLFSALTHFQCVYLRLFHVICPGCGMTRSVKALLGLRFGEAFRLHPMVYAMPLVAAYIVADGHLFPKRAVNALVLALIAAGFLINYAVKLAPFLA